MLEELEATPVLGGMAGGGGGGQARKKGKHWNSKHFLYAGEDSDEDEEVGLWDLTRSSCACLALLLEAVAAAAAAAAARQRPRTSDLLQCAPKDSATAELHWLKKESSELALKLKQSGSIRSKPKLSES